LARIGAARLEEFCRHLLVRAGMTEAEAAVVAAVLVDASLEGVETHGVSRLPVYVRCLRRGRINPRPQLAVRRDGAVALVDGDNGMGQLVGVRAMEVAVQLAREYGVGAAAVKRSNHFGAASYYCKLAARAGMVGVAFTNSSPGIPPWGGRRAYLGTNPIAFAFPGPEYPVVVDLSSSTVARGNIILAAREGKPIPAGWALDREGRPTTDPRAALEGAVLPVGGAKGYALALAVEVMAGILTGASFGPRVGWIYDDGLEPADVGHFFLALDIGRFLPREEFVARLGMMIREVKAVPLAEGYNEIFVPGERRFLRAQKQRLEGIPLEPGLIAELNRLAAEAGVEPLEIEEATGDSGLPL